MRNLHVEELLVQRNVEEDERGSGEDGGEVVVWRLFI